MPNSDQDNWQALSARLDRKPLRPLSESHLNVRVPGNGDLKRKRGTEINDYELRKPFTVLASLPLEGQLELKPRILIPRSCLPLAYFDLEADSQGSTGSRIFSASEQSLEILAASRHQAYEPRILIADHGDDHRLYVVESIRQGVYALCRLAEWVKLEDFEKRPSKARKISHGDHAPSVAGDGQWWRRAALDIRKNAGEPKRPSHPEGIRLAMKPPSSRTKLTTIQDLEATTSAHTPEYQATNAGIMLDTAVNGRDEHPQPPTINPVDVYDLIRMQYLEALYINKTSLAYFAKGPLSRARAATQGDSSSIELPELVECLREAILSISTNDKKYGESLPKLIAELPVGITSEDEDGLLADQIRKAKKRKKMSKGGLSPGEEQYLIKWWLYRERVTLSAGPGHTREQRAKEALTEQRAREIQLQLILILEVLALEAACITHISKIKAPNVQVDNSQAQSKKFKKPLNLPTLLDVLIDRLCIWHSTSQGEMRETDLVHRQQQGEKLGLRASESDCLRDFCTEVVVPFYATRLPELCPSICRKLGGPVVPPPLRPSMQKPSNTQRVLSLPGVPIERTHPRSRKPLERVLTDSKIKSRRPPATLVRSATDSALPRFKRELSEIAMASIPASRPSLQHSKRYSQREVDLTTMSQATQARLKKKAAIEQELQGAIATLKKPNPRMAVKELVEASEKRATAGLQPKKSKNPVRNPLAQGIQVMATPHVNRHKNLYADLPRLPNRCPTEREEPEMIPPSSDPRIPSSSHKPPPVPELRFPDNLASLSSNSATLRPLPALDVTPSHRPSKLGRSLLCASQSLVADPNPNEADADADAEDELSQGSPALPAIPKSQLTFKRPLLPGRTPSFESPRASGSKTVQETPSRKKAPPRRWDRAVGTPRGVITGTPVNRISGKGAGMGADTPVKTSNSLGVVVGGEGGAEKDDGGQEREPEQDVSIYQTLGWDDDVDDLI